MGRLMETLLVLCLTSCSLSTRAAALGAHDLRRGLQRAMRGRLLADATAPGGAVVPFHSSRELYNVANFTIGTPPQPASAFIDVSGVSVWTQCKQCQRCFKQDLPLFDPTASNTYRPEPCGSALCESIPKDNRNCSGNVCIYEEFTEYGETGGKVGTDTFAIGTVKASLVFGCIVASDFDTMGGPSGFIGLGRTPWSLVAQMELTKFSYCLAPHGTGKNSRLFLGSSAKLAGGESSWTPFVKISPDDDLSQYYPVKLEEIKAGDASIAMPQGRNTVMLVSTIHLVTLLVDSVYQDFKKAVLKAVGTKPTATPVQPFELCFPKAGVSSAPDLVFTFQAGAALTVPPSKYLYDVGSDTVCLSVMSKALLNITAWDGLNILGSLQKENVHFLFDLEKNTLSFEPADCSSLS